MKRSTRVIGFTYLLGMAACILPGSIPTALAGGYDEAVSSGPFTPLVAEAAETYWTPERRASALPVPLPEVSRGPTVTQAPQQKAAPGRSWLLRQEGQVKKCREISIISQEELTSYSVGFLSLILATGCFQTL